MNFPDAIDNTIRETFVICPEKARRAYIEDLDSPSPSVHLHFGGAAAAGWETARREFYERGKTAEWAVEQGVMAALRFWGDFEPPVKATKTRESLEQCIRYYFDTWPMQYDVLTPKNIEWRFAIPIPDLIHPDHGGPIFYSGRSDAPGDLAGVYTIEDDKTASSLGESWAKQWVLDSQFTGYAWAAVEQGLMDPDSPGPVLVRGVSILTPKFEKDGTYIRAKSFGHDQALVYRPKWMRERWLRQLQRDVRRMISSYLNNEWDLALHKNACAAYGGCKFKDMCLSQDPESWIPLNYVKRKWNPMDVV